jgi:hypothetical protein
VSQFWEHFEILKKKIHFNIVIKIIYKIYYKQEMMASPKFESFTKYIINKKMMDFPKFESFTKYIIKKKMMTFPKFESLYVLCLCELFGIHLCFVLIPICINYFFS